MSKPLAYRHHLRAIALWPKDPLRPETSFQSALQRRIERRFKDEVRSARGSEETRAGGSAPAPAASASASAPATAPVSPLVDSTRGERIEGFGKNPVENGALKGSRSGKGADLELEQVNALYLLLEDRFKKRAKTYLRPASNPDYYVDLLAEMEAVSQRGWFASWLNSWKGWIRFT
ncbi:MAG: hypothetical protein M1815_000514 [Lichina confinis]|nr:MAG: hypothetical protein M1815_000514 [Lichina confinis]